MKLKLSILVVAVTAFAISGCDASTPSASDAEQEIRKQISEQSQGRINLLEFQKTDGQAREVFGRKIYALEFLAKIQYIEACRADFVWGGGFGGFSSFKTQEITTEDYGGMNALDAARAKIAARMFHLRYVVKKNQIVYIQGTMVFQKKESGWKLFSQRMPIMRMDITKQ